MPITPQSHRQKARLARDAAEGRAALEGAQQSLDAVKPPIYVPRGSTDPLWLAQLKQQIRTRGVVTP